MGQDRYNNVDWSFNDDDEFSMIDINTLDGNNKVINIEFPERFDHTVGSEWWMKKKTPVSSYNALVKWEADQVSKATKEAWLSFALFLITFSFVIINI